MQTKILISLCVLFMSTAVNAQQTFSVVTNDMKPLFKETSFTASVIPDKTTAAFVLHVFNPAKKRIDLQICHRVNGIVVDTVITDMEFNCRYNFGLANDGEYLITLINGKEKVNKLAIINTVVTRNAVVE